MTKRTMVVAAVAVLAACAACGSTKAPVAREDVKPKTMSVIGSVEVFGHPVDGSGCAASSGYDDISEGAQVVIRNSNDRKIALGSLNEPAMNSDGLTCSLTFEIEDVPATDSLYSVEVAHRGQVNFKRADAGAINLTLE